MDASDTSDRDRPVYDPETDTYRLHADTGNRISIVAIVAVSHIADLDPLEMAPVYDGHNLDVLDQVAAMQETDSVDFDGSVTVSIADHQVSLHSDGSLVIMPPA